jgi:hypothetical protein
MIVSRATLGCKIHIHWTVNLNFNMRRLTIALIAIFAMQIFHVVFGQGVTIDLTQIDTGLVVVKLASDVDSSATDTVVTVAVPSAGKMELKMVHNSVRHSMVRFDVNTAGEISHVEWKPNAKEATEYTDLDSALFELTSDLKGISFSSCGIYIDDSQLDVDLQLSYFDPVTEESTFFGDPDNSGMYEIFPGDFRLTSTASPAVITFLVHDDCQVDPAVEWLADIEAPAEFLHVDLFDTEPNSLIFNRNEIEAKFHVKSGQAAHLDGFKESMSALQDNVAEPLSVLPGAYKISVEESGVPVAEVSFVLLNKTARLSPTLYWKDLQGEATNGEMVALEAGYAYLTPESFDAASGFPLTDEETVPNPYAVLKDKLDASYYIAVAGELWFRYDERYEESADLNLKIYNMDYQEMSLSGPVTRHYGANWIQLQLPGNEFVVGDYYVLEVRSEKGDLSLLRFRYEQ